MKNNAPEESSLKGTSKIITDNLSPIDLYRLWEVQKNGSQEAAEKATTLPQTSFSRAIMNLNEQLTKETGREIKIYKKERGRNILTGDGEIVYAHAQEMMSIIFDLPVALGPQKFTIAVTSAFPQYLSYFLLRELLSIPNPVKFRLVSAESGNWADRLLDNTYDLVLADGHIPDYVSDRTEKIFIHAEGETHPIIVADEELIKRKKLKENFPHSLNNIPFVMPPPDSTLAKALNAWFNDKKIKVKPNVIAETNDRLLMVLLAQKGAAVIGISSVVAPPVCELQNLMPLHHITDTKFHENFFAIARKRHAGNTWAIDHILQRITDFSKNPPKPDWGVGKLSKKRKSRP